MIEAGGLCEKLGTEWEPVVEWSAQRMLTKKGEKVAAKQRVMKNTVQGQILSTMHVSAKIDPFFPLDGDELGYFNAIVKSRETATWNDNHRILATNLAITYAQLYEANQDIAERGLMVRNEKGTMVTNPAISAKSSLSATVLQLNRTLGLTAGQNGISGPAQEKRNQADAHARALLTQIAENDLI